MDSSHQRCDDISSIQTSLSYAMDDADTLLCRARQAELDALNMDLNWPKMKIISNLAAADGEGLSLTELAKCCLRELSTVSSLLSKLEYDELVTRRSGKKRERCRFVLTEKGKDLFYNRMRNSSAGMFFDTLTPTEQKTLLELLHKLTVGGKEMLGIDFIPKFLQ